jgi:hypothetical protein
LAVPAVSVVLPSFNRAGTLGRAIRSVLAQTFADLELVIVDDASTDDTESLVHSFTDPRIRYLRLEQNRGAAGARNAGIEAARGTWTAFQDSDDEWLVTKLAQQMAAADSGAGLILGGYIAVGQGRPRMISPASTLSGHDALPDILDGWPIITPTWLVRRELLQRLGGFNPAYPCLEDWDLAFRLSDICAVGAVQEPVLVKHGSLDSVCADPRRLCDAMERIIETHGHRWRHESRRLARRLAHLGCLQYRIGRGRQGRVALRQAFACAPWTPATQMLLCASYGGRLPVRAVQRLWAHFASMAP